MNIKTIYPEALAERPEALYALTQADSVNCKDVDPREELTVRAYCLYEKPDKDGNMVEVLSIATDEQGVMATVSATFKRSFADIAAIAPVPFKVRVKHGTSKAGREFVDCELVYDATALFGGDNV